jgi:Holliday junction DNA helicase RuvB
LQRIIQDNQTIQDIDNENILRPKSFDDYIGQEQIKKNLKVFIQAAIQRMEALDHMLFFGPPGLGKTTLAHIVANEMNTSIKIISAPNIEKTGDLAAILTNLQDGDILFIDEIHRLSSTLEEILYPAMEDYKIDLIIGSGPAANTMQIDIPKFTLIGATTRAGMLSAPLRDRFGIHFRLKFYSIEELQEIIVKAAVKLQKSCQKEASSYIASRSRLTPRIALRLLRRVRDFAEVNNDNKISNEVCSYALKQLGIKDEGFDEMDIKLLATLLNANSPMGLSTLSAILNEDPSTIEDVLEPYLLANNFIEKTSKGRIATKHAMEIFQEDKELSCLIKRKGKSE